MLACVCEVGVGSLLVMALTVLLHVQNQLKRARRRYQAGLKTKQVFTFKNLGVGGEDQPGH